MHRRKVPAPPEDNPSQTLWAESAPEGSESAFGPVARSAASSRRPEIGKFRRADQLAAGVIAGVDASVDRRHVGSVQPGDAILDDLLLAGTFVLPQIQRPRAMDLASFARRPLKVAVDVFCAIAGLVGEGDLHFAHFLGMDARRGEDAGDDQRGDGGSSGRFHRETSFFLCAAPVSAGSPTRWGRTEISGIEKG